MRLYRNSAQSVPNVPAPRPAARQRYSARQFDDASGEKRRNYEGMLAAIHSAAVLGIEAYNVTVEVDCALGLPQWFIVGLPAGSVRESRERVGAALANSGFKIPPRRITTNLAPADFPQASTPLPGCGES